MGNDTPSSLVREIVAIIQEADWLSSEDRAEVDRIIAERGTLLEAEQEAQLLAQVIRVLRAAAVRAGDEKMATSLDGEPIEIARRIINRYGVRQRANGSVDKELVPQVRLLAFNGVVPGPVRPTPLFHGRAIPMNGGFVRVRDLQPWEGNLRLEIHLAQFREQHGRGPSKDELLSILQGRLPLPGLSKTDEFEIEDLARSIAANGVQRPPILDTDGSVLEGNRRVASSYHILESDEFTTAQKARAEYMYVWQLTEHATDEDREAVIVASNFEPDYKKQWADYIRAKKVYQEWEAMLSREPMANARRQAQMKSELSMKYALGPNTNTVNRYLKMMEWANDFETYQAVERGRDPHPVRHQANRYFQYFDEMAKGVSAGGVAWTLNQDEPLKHLVFDLLYEGKFASWRPIRGLKFVALNEEARSYLVKAREEPDVETAQDLVEDAVNTGRLRSAAARQTGANTRIENFLDWLVELPVKAFREQITPENLQRLQQAFRYVDKMAAAALAERRQDSNT